MNSLDTVFESPLAQVAADSDGIDCLVIGSGTAGVTTALTLADHGLRVVILEAGPLWLTSHLANANLSDATGLAAKLSDAATIPVRWETSNGDADEPVPAWVGVGGRTCFWGGVTPRYKAWDFDDWPIDAADMAPFYDRAEALMKVGGNGERPPFYESGGQRRAIERLTSSGLIARATPVGIDTGSDRRLGAGFDSSPARLLASAHLGAFADGALVSLVAQAVAVRLVLDGERVSAVEVRDRRTGEHVQLRARHVVLAGGAVQSTRLALSSDLDARSPLVGHYISDHLYMETTAPFTNPGEGTNMNVMVDPTPQWPVQLQIQGAVDGTWYDQAAATLWVNCSPDGDLMLFAAFGIGSVEKDNRVVLSDGGDPDLGGMQDFRVIYDRTDQDRALLETMERSLRRAAVALDTTAGDMQVLQPGAALHEIGGLRMAADAGDGVTDPWGRFWRVENLSTSDTSAFRTQGAGNPYLTITAWSLRHAEALAHSLGVKR